jgi:hypothetical protein
MAIIVHIILPDPQILRTSKELRKPDVIHRAKLCPKSEQLELYASQSSTGLQFHGTCLHSGQKTRLSNDKSLNDL